jgi:hypothetical protein
MKKIIFILALLLLVSPAMAQEAEKDNTGTNPVNFTNDLRIYHNFSELNTAGDGSANTTTVQFRTPFADGKWQLQMKLPFVAKEIDLTGNGVNNIDDSGVGNLSVRFLTVPILKMEKKFALATGLEVGFDTSNDPKIGESSTTLGPQVFAVFFKPPGGGALVAPAYQHVFNVGGKKANRSLLDVFYLYSFKDKFINWAMINPQAVINYESDNDTHVNIDLEAGKMISKTQSVYLRPGFGIGGDRLFDWDMEVGWKMVW